MPLFFVNGAFNGFAAGGSDTAVNVWMMELYNDKQGPSMLQALHFAFGSGSILAPLIDRPFLANHNGINSTEIDLTSQESLIYIPYLVCGIIILLAAGFLGVLFIYEKYEPPKREESHHRSSLVQEIERETSR